MADRWAVLGCDSDGVTVEWIGGLDEMPAWIADAAQQEEDRWPEHGLVYMLTEADQAPPAGQVAALGIPARSAPEVYRGVGVMVVRDQAGTPVVAFDSNGTVVFLAGGLTMDLVDVAFPMTDDDVRGVVS